MRVVLDTNVLISAFISAKGSPAQILNRWLNGEIEVLISLESLAELERVLTYDRVRKRLHYSDEQLEQVMALLREQATLVTPVDEVQIVEADPDDDKFFTLAVAGEARYIVSGDPHVLGVGQYQGIEVVTPAAFVALLTSQDEG